MDGEGQNSRNLSTGAARMFSSMLRNLFTLDQGLVLNIRVSDD